MTDKHHDTGVMGANKAGKKAHYRRGLGAGLLPLSSS